MRINVKRLDEKCAEKQRSRCQRDSGAIFVAIRARIFAEISIKIYKLKSRSRLSMFFRQINSLIFRSRLHRLPASPRRSLARMFITSGCASSSDIYIFQLPREGELRFIVATCFSSPEVRPHRCGRTSELYQPLRASSWVLRTTRNDKARASRV